VAAVVVAKTSRVIEVMIGTIMMSTMIPAVMKLSPVGLGSAVRSPINGMPEVAERCCRRCRRGVWVSTAKRPEPVDDRRDRGQEVPPSR